MNITTREKNHGTRDQDRKESYFRILIERGRHRRPQGQLLASASAHPRGFESQGYDDCQISQVPRLPQRRLQLAMVLLHRDDEGSRVPS